MDFLYLCEQNGNMTIQEIRTRKDGQTFDCKSIQIEPKALAIPIVTFANADVIYTQILKYNK